MNDVRREIRFHGMKPTKCLQRLVQRQIEKWIVRAQSLLFFPKDGSYSVVVEKEANLPFITCHLRIQVGSKVWESHDTGKTVEQALFRAIQTLRAPWPEELIRIPRVIYAEGAA